jgi:hypothetical protein
VQDKPSRSFKNLALEVTKLYRKKDDQLTIDDFILPFGGALAADNRWVIKSRLLPWDEIEDTYANLFPSGTGNVAKPARMALVQSKMNNVKLKQQKAMHFLLITGKMYGEG